MAKLLSFSLSDVNFKTLYSSDLNRCVETLKIVMEGEYLLNNKIEPIITSELREKNCGIYEGKKISLMREDMIKSNKNMREYKPQGGESWLDVFIRSKTFLNDLIKNYVKKDFVDPTLIDTDYYLSSISKQFEQKLTLTENKPKMNNNTIKVNHPHKTINFKKQYIQGGDNKKFNRDNTISGGLVEDSFMDNPDKEKNDIITIIEKKQVQPYKLSEIKYEYYFLTKDFNSLLVNKEISKKIKFHYNGFNLNNNLPRILILSHSGFILEFLNVIRQRKKVSPKFISDTKQTALFVIKIYCFVCGGVCYSKSKDCQLEYDLIVYNNTNHLGKKVIID